MTDLAANLQSAQAETRQLRDGLRHDLAILIAASADANADDEHDPEGATIAFERAQLTASIEQAERRLRELAEGEQRLAAGEYDRCESCGGSIGEQRLLARPATRRCVDCA